MAKKEKKRLTVKQEFEDSEWVIRIRKSVNRQFNGKKKGEKRLQVKQEFEDSEGVIRSRKSVKRQFNGQK